MFRTSALCFIVLASAGSPLPAQPGQPPRRLVLEALDRNHDGQLSPDEIEAATASLLTLDRNHDGQLTPDEYIPKEQVRPDLSGSKTGSAGYDHVEGMVRTDPILNAIDINHDGVLSAAELASAPGALKALDTDADGTLQPNELRIRPQTPAHRAVHVLDAWAITRNGE